MEFIEKWNFYLQRIIDWFFSRFFNKRQILIQFYALVRVAITRAKAANNYLTLFGVHQFPYIISKRRGICYFVLFENTQLSRSLFDFYDVIHSQQRAIEPLLSQDSFENNTLRIDEIRRRVIINSLNNVLNTMPKDLSKDVNRTVMKLQSAFESKGFSIK